MNKLDFIKILIFLSQFGGFTKLADPKVQKELWDYYLEQNEQ